MIRDGVERSATFSACGLYRYTLHRVWRPDAQSLAVVGLNPSTADEKQDDPTIRRCMGFAERWGCGSLTMLNLFAYRSTSPAELRMAIDPIGTDNDDLLVRHAKASDVVLCAWGAHGSLYGRADRVVRLLRVDAGQDLFHLGMTKGGQPRHPLYLRSDTALVLWTDR